MAVTIRLTRQGRKKLPFYRIVAADKSMKRDGRFLEQLGTVDPLTDPVTVKMKEDRVKYWISVGAYPSDTVAQIIEKQIPGYFSAIQKKRRDQIIAARKKRKARAGGKKAPKKEASGKKAAKKAAKKATPKAGKEAAKS